VPTIAAFAYGGYQNRTIKSRRQKGRGFAVNKTELIEHIARQADISKAAAGRALEAIVGGIRVSLKKGNSVTLVGFGTFMVGKRAARVGRNPRTNQPIKIKAAKVPKFRAGKALKDAVN
jgi:DNA-binding protein HU-beta